MRDADSLSSALLERPRATDHLALRSLIVAVYVVLFWGLLPLLLWQLGLRFDRWLGLPLPWPLARRLGAAIALLFAWPLGYAMWLLLRRGRGLPISHLPPRLLVASGLYARVRHPIYVCFTLALSGLSLWLGSVGAALGSGLVLTLAWIAYALVFEEPRLRQRFGSAYDAYAERTPLLPLPRWMIAPMAASWQALLPCAQWLADRTVLWRGKRWSLVTYGPLVALGTVCMTGWAGAALSGVSREPARLPWLAPVVCAAMLVGGRVGGLLYRTTLLRAAPGQALRTVGFVSWGGYLGMALAAPWAAQVLGLAPGALLDRLLLPGLACSAIGRLGCLSYGCCGGRPCAGGVVWRNPDARILRELGPAAAVPRLPTQLLSSAWALCVLAMLWWPSTRALPSGVLWATGCLLYALGRISIERLREEESLTRLALTRGQLACLAVAFCAMGYLLTHDASAFTPVHGPHVQLLDGPWLSALACGALTLLVAGLHGRRIGYW